MLGTSTSPDGVSIRFEERGTGFPVLVFVHGWSCDRRYWAPQVDEFGERSRVVVLDLAGHGESGQDRRDWTMASFGADVVAVADDLGLDRMVLIGHSMGGDVIVEAALRLGSRVAGLVWVDTYNALGDPRSQDEINAVLAPLRNDFVAGTRELIRGLSPSSTDPELVEWILDDMSSAPPEIAVNALEHAISFEPEIVESLPRISAPVVAINPDDGRSDRESLHRHGVRLVLVPGVGHFMMMEAPRRFNHVLAHVIDEIVE